MIPTIRIHRPRRTSRTIDAPDRWRHVTTGVVVGVLSALVAVYVMGWPA